MKRIILIAVSAVTAWSCFSEEFTWSDFERFVAVQTNGKTPYELVEKYHPGLTDNEVSEKVQEIYEYYYSNPTELIIQEEDYGRTNKNS